MAEPGSNVRMAGYLEKRGKLKLMGSWKKYWFVLEGQLLLYYKSQLEYINLSACRGSLNIGLASCVRPGQGFTIQVVTRTQCTTLRTKERVLQEQWLQALLDSMALPNTSSLKRQATGPQHFRYSLDNLPAINEGEECSARDCEKKTTLPRRVSRGDSMLFRIRRMGGISYGGNSESIIPSIPRLKLSSDKKNTIIPEVYKRTSEDSLDRMDSELSLEDEGQSEELQSKEKFRNNLESIRDLLEQTNQGMDKTASQEYTNSKCNHKENQNQELPTKEKLEKMPMVEEKCSRQSSGEQEQDSSTEGTEHSESSKSMTEDEPHEILTTAQIHDENKKCDNTIGENKEDQYNETMKENTYCYESLQTLTPGQGQDINEEDYYSTYDQFALMRSLLEEVEPAIPPRPDHEIYKSTTHDSSTVELAKRKSEKKHVFIEKIHQLLKKTPSKEKELKELPIVINCQECRGEIVLNKEENNADVESEEDYYSCYDRFAIAQNALEEEEPSLPPRPDHEIYKSISSESDIVEYNGEKSKKRNSAMGRIHQLLKLSPSKERRPSEPEAEPEEDYYSCYDKFAIVQNYLDEVEPTLPPRPDHEIYKSMSGESDLTENGGRSEKKNVFKNKIHQLLRKTPSKELKDSEDDQLPKKPKKRRSHSFLKALGFRPKKKERKRKTETYDEESEEEPEYESVDYMVQEAQRKLSREEEALDNQQLHKILPVNTMLELKHKLRGRSLANLPSDEEAELYEAILGMRGEDRRPSMNSSQIEEKSITTSTSSKSSSNNQEYAVHNNLKKKNISGSLSLVLPSLPPRGTARPSSPWHDIPTNNSPVHGNGSFSLDPSINRARDKTSNAPFFLVPSNNDSKPKVAFPIVPDEILNTPEGFLHIQSRWRQAELSGDWSREQLDTAFPAKEKIKLLGTLEREKIDISSNGDEELSIDNDSLREENEETNSLNKCSEDSQLDSLERRESKKSEKNSKNGIHTFGGEENGTKCQEERKSDPSVELRIQPKLRNGRNKSLPMQQDKCLEFELVDFSTNGKGHHLSGLSTNELHNHGILNNQEHNREIMSINRYSDELHLLLAQLAEITSAPLFNAGATKSLITQTTTTQTTLDEELGPIRRRRHSDPDYDIPRPHGSLQYIVQDAPDPSMSPDSLEPSMEGKHYLKDLC